MAARFIAALAFGVAAITACDLSQTTPQTVTPPVAFDPVAPAGTVLIEPAARSTADMPLRAGSGATVGERSIRLYGRGVNRKRQTRV